MDIQAQLDKWLAENPEAQKYISKLWYIPDGTDTPAGVTHIVSVQSVTSAERVLRVGAEVVPKYAVFVDMILSMVATQTPPPTMPPTM